MLRLFVAASLLISVQCKILRVGEHFTANFVLVDSNSRLTKGCVHNSTVNSLRHCVSNCIKDESCSTFNFHKIENICELMNMSKFDEVDILRKGKSWTHYETDEDASLIGPVCHATSPCSKNEVCEDTFKRNPYYICRCRDGFNGSDCNDYQGIGKTEQNPAPSCHLLMARYSSIPAGDYYIKGKSKVVKRHCKRRGVTEQKAVTTSPAPTTSPGSTIEPARLCEDQDSGCASDTRDCLTNNHMINKCSKYCGHCGTGTCINLKGDDSCNDAEFKCVSVTRKLQCRKRCGFCAPGDKED